MPKARRIRPARLRTVPRRQVNTTIQTLDGKELSLFPNEMLEDSSAFWKKTVIGVVLSGTVAGGRLMADIRFTQARNRTYIKTLHPIVVQAPASHRLLLLAKALL